MSHRLTAYRSLRSLQRDNRVCRACAEAGYPGRAQSGRGDRTPTSREQALCSCWRELELRLLRPRLIVTVGGLAARQLLGLTSLTPSIGERLSLGEATAIPLPHPSGASGWLDDAGNRARLQRGLIHVQEELARIG